MLYLAHALPAAAQPTEQPLVDDFSRSYLANYAASFDDQCKALPYPFSFPEDAKATSIFGIDVSHHQGKITWSTLPQHNVVFVVAKASQGENFFDPNFAGHWSDLASLQKAHPGIYKGAYHFLS